MKQSIAEARKVQALEAQAKSIAEIEVAIIRLESKIDILLGDKKPPETPKPDAAKKNV